MARVRSEGVGNGSEGGGRGMVKKLRGDSR